jgi:large subunit ribosomal protein L28
MSKKCELTGKSPLKGHKVSHANNKIKRKFYPNLKKVNFISKILRRKFTLNVSNAALRTVDYKGGIDPFLKSADKSYLSFKAKKLKKRILSRA